MKNSITIDLPVLCEGNLHKINIPLLLESLNNIKKLKDVELMLGEDAMVLLSENKDEFFTREIWKFIGDVNSQSYDNSVRKNDLTHTPSIIDDSLSEKMRDAVYLQLCMIRVTDTPDQPLLFVGFIPRFTEKFILSTIRDKKKRQHPTIIIETDEDLNAWIFSSQPHLDQKKHKAEAYETKRGVVSPFTSFFRCGPEYAEGLLLQAFMEARDKEYFPHYLYTWDEEAGLYVEFRHENHKNDSQHNYHGRDLNPMDYDRVPDYIRDKYHK